MKIEQLQSLLEVGIYAAESAGQVISKHFRHGQYSISRKSNGTIVTEADHDAEQAIRTILRQNPLTQSMDIIGEEQGLEDMGSQYRWLIDPIDGTRSFINRIPLFGTILALLDTERATPFLGIIHLPILGQTFSAAHGLGCFCNGARVRVSSCATPEHAIVSVGDPLQFTVAECEDIYHRLSRLCPFLRGYTDCFGHTLVLRGAVAAMLDPALHLWDLMAVQLMVEEAGGKIKIRPSKYGNNYDALLGSPVLIDYLARELHF